MCQTVPARKRLSRVSPIDGCVGPIDLVAVGSRFNSDPGDRFRLTTSVFRSEQSLTSTLISPGYGTNKPFPSSRAPLAVADVLNEFFAISTMRGTMFMEESTVCWEARNARVNVNRVAIATWLRCDVFARSTSLQSHSGRRTIPWMHRLG